MYPKYKKRAKPVDAFQITKDTKDDPLQWPIWLSNAILKEKGTKSIFKDHCGDLWVHLPCGYAKLVVGDWIVRTSNDTYKVYNSTDFELLYEKIV